jgi:micrococcal nuclease
MYEYSAKIIRVVDGDTVDVDIDLGFGVVLSNQRIRLHGIDTPESRTRDLVEKKFGLFAKEFLERTLGETCTLRTTLDKKGKFGRILGKFIVYDAKTDSHMSVNDIMVRDRLAIPYMGSGSREERREQHQQNFNYLIENGIVE